jgi:hypothetical protein
MKKEIWTRMRLTVGTRMKMIIKINSKMDIYSRMRMKMWTKMTIYGVDLLITDSWPTRFITLFGKYEKGKKWYVKNESWHMTHDTWYMTHDTLHLIGNRLEEVNLLQKMYGSVVLTALDLEATFDTWHLTKDMWHVTPDMWHVSQDKYRVVNILSTFQDPISYCLGVKGFWTYLAKGSVT